MNNNLNCIVILICLSIITTDKVATATNLTTSPTPTPTPPTLEPVAATTSESHQIEYTPTDDSPSPDYNIVEEFVTVTDETTADQNAYYNITNTSPSSSETSTAISNPPAAEVVAIIPLAPTSATNTNDHEPDDDNKVSNVLEPFLEEQMPEHEQGLGGQEQGPQDSIIENDIIDDNFITARGFYFRRLLCPSIPIELLSTYRFHLITRRCYKIGTQGPCNNKNNTLTTEEDNQQEEEGQADMIFIKEPLTYAIGKCVLRIKEEDKMVQAEEADE